MCVETLSANALSSEPKGPSQSLQRRVLARGAAVLGNTLTPLSQDPVNNLIKVYKPHIMEPTWSRWSSVQEVTGSVPTAAPVREQSVSDPTEREDGRQVAGDQV